MRYIPEKISIEQEGLKNYLDRTKADHKGFGYERFIQMLNDEKHYTKHQIAIEFKVNRATIYRWLDLYKRER